MFDKITAVLIKYLMLVLNVKKALVSYILPNWNSNFDFDFDFVNCETFINFRISYNAVKPKTEVDKFLSRLPTFRLRYFIFCPTGHAKNGWSRSRCTSNRIERQIETLLFLLYNLNRAFVFNVLSLKVLQQDFCSLNVVLMSKIRCDSKNNFHISDLLV